MSLVCAFDSKSIRSVAYLLACFCFCRRSIALSICTSFPIQIYLCIYSTQNQTKTVGPHPVSAFPPPRVAPPQITHSLHPDPSPSSSSSSASPSSSTNVSSQGSWNEL